MSSSLMFKRSSQVKETPAGQNYLVIRNNAIDPIIEWNKLKCEGQVTGTCQVAVWVSSG